MVGSFVKVKCRKCNNEQNLFSKVSTEVKCLVCGEIIAKPSGGSCDFTKCDVLDRMTY